MKVLSVAQITQAVRRQLEGHPLLDGVVVTRSEQLNADPSQCPWVGVYRARVQYPIRTLGNAAQSRYQNAELILVCQDTSGASGAECEDKVEALVANVLAALFDNQFLKADDSSPGLIDAWDAIEVHYQSYTKTDNVFMQTVNLYITAMNRTN